MPALDYPRCICEHGRDKVVCTLKHIESRVLGRTKLGIDLQLVCVLPGTICVISCVQWRHHLQCVLVNAITRVILVFVIDSAWVQCTEHCRQ